MSMAISPPDDLDAVDGKSPLRFLLAGATPFVVRRLVVHSMVSFGFAPHAAGTDRTGILDVKPGAGRSLGDTLIQALGSRPGLG